MFKKTACLFLCLLLLVAGGAFADEIGILEGKAITITPPEGYAVTPQELEGGILASISTEDEQEVQFSMSVAYSEQFSGYTLNVNALTAEEYEQMVNRLTEDFDSPEIQILTAEDGSNVILVDEQGAESDYAYLLTIYEGYFAEVTLFKTSGQLSDEDIQMARDILSSTRSETAEK